MSPATAIQRNPSGGFSLAEVVLALGIVSISLLAIFAVFAGTVKSSSDLSDRRMLLESVDALQAYLNESSGFEQVFDWVSGGNEDPQDLVYVSYRADAAGDPDPQAEQTRSIWVEPDEAPNYDAAREGKWVKAWLEFDPDANAAADLTGNAADFEQAVLVVRVTMAAVGTADAEQPETPDFTSHVAVRR